MGTYFLSTFTKPDTITNSLEDDKLLKILELNVWLCGKWFHLNVLTRAINIKVELLTTTLQALPKKQCFERKYNKKKKVSNFNPLKLTWEYNTTSFFFVKTFSSWHYFKNCCFDSMYTQCFPLLMWQGSMTRFKSQILTSIGIVSYWKFYFYLFIDELSNIDELIKVAQL